MKKGEAKTWLRRNKGRHSNINKICPFLGGKQFFIKRKERTKEKKKKKTPQKIRRV